MASDRTTARLEAEVSKDLFEKIEQAAALRGQTVAEFVVDATAIFAEDVIEHLPRIELTPEEQIRFAEILLDPPPPTETLKRAFEHHSRLTGQK